MNTKEKPGVMAGRFNQACSTGYENPTRAVSNSQSPFRLSASNWNPLPKNSLEGFFDLLISEVGLQIHGCALHTREGSRWVQLPSRPYVDKEGKQTWQNIFEFTDILRRRVFQEAALKAIDQFREAGQQ